MAFSEPLRTYLKGVKTKAVEGTYVAKIILLGAKLDTRYDPDSYQ